MLRKTLISVAVLGAMAVASPALATNKGGCKGRDCSTSSTSSSGGWNTTSSSGGNTSTSTSSTSSTSGGTKVPEPGMLGLAGAGLAGLGFMQLRRRRQASK